MPAIFDPHGGIKDQFDVYQEARRQEIQDQYEQKHKVGKYAPPERGGGAYGFVDYDEFDPDFEARTRATRDAYKAELASGFKSLDSDPRYKELKAGLASTDPGQKASYQRALNDYIADAHTKWIDAYWKGFSTSPPTGGGVSAAAPPPSEGAQPAPHVTADPMTQPALANAGLVGGATQTGGTGGGTFMAMSPGGVASPVGAASGAMGPRAAGGMYSRPRTGFAARSGGLGSSFKRVAPATGAGRGMPVRPIGPS